MPTLSTFVCNSTIERLNYVVVKTSPSMYQVIKYRHGTIPNDSDIRRGTLLSDAVHQLIVDACKIGYLVLEADSCGFEVDQETRKLVGATYQ